MHHDYRIARDGLTVQSMDLTGKKTLAYKLAYLWMPFTAWRPCAPRGRHSAHGVAFNLVTKAAAQVHCTALKALIQGNAGK